VPNQNGATHQSGATKSRARYHGGAKIVLYEHEKTLVSCGITEKTRVLHE
jgi:hypothetical protein